jgi:hypothetical protein
MPSSTKRIVYNGNDSFVAGGDGILYSNDGGKTWKSTNAPYFTGITAIVSDGNGNFVVADSKGKVVSSNNGGTTWEKSDIKEDESSGTLYSMAYGNGRFVRVHHQYGTTMYSSNRKNWHPGGNTGLSSYTIRITYGNGKFVAVDQQGKTAHSPDGETWIVGGDTGLPSIESITYGDGNFVAVNSKGDAAYSKDGGVTWTAVEDTTFGSTGISDIAYGGGMVVIVGGGQGAYSTDGGITWTATNLNNFGAVNAVGIAYGNGKFVAVGRNGKVAYSNKLE